MKMWGMCQGGMAYPAAAVQIPSPPPHSSSPPRLGRRHPLLPILTNCKTIDHFKQIHTQSLKSFLHSHNSLITPEDHLYLYSRLIHLSSTTFHDLQYSTLLLHHHPISPNPFIYNTLISSFSNYFSLRLYLHMISHGILPDKHTFPLLLKSCSYHFLILEGQQIQTHVVKFGFVSDVYVGNSLVHFYASCGKMGSARKAFEGMTERSPVSWNALIDGYVTCGEYEVAINLFREMQKIFDPDGYTIQSIAYACAGLATLSLGMWIHGYVMRKCDRDVVDDVLVSNALLDMYCKCGCVEMARQLFERMTSRDVVSWNYMILGFATSGLVKEALQAFEEMCKTKGLKPNSITFVGVLSACNHGGLVAEGRRYFTLMVTEFSIEPRIEHYGCLIDLIARAGLIEEALDVVHDMPFEPDAVIYRCLLDACSKTQSDIEIAESLVQSVYDSEDEATSGAVILLTKMYATSNRWIDVALIRGLMDEEGIRKQPGCSLTEINDCVHEFLAGDTSHPRSKDIYLMLQLLAEDVPVDSSNLLPLHSDLHVDILSSSVSSTW